MSHTDIKKFIGTYDNIISVENLLLAWREFRVGKKNKPDVQQFEYNLMGNILELHTELKEKRYIHGAYQAFKINDPKPRDIHKASVRDRVLHHAFYRVLSPFYFRIFIVDSYSCQIGKGTHRALNCFEQFHRKVSENNTRQAWVLKCDVWKFFANIDHEVLIVLLRERIVDTDITNLLSGIIKSFDTDYIGLLSKTKFANSRVHMQDLCTKGLPLGNLTSQLLVNIYMHEFDMYIKQTLKVKHYIRYADDFVILTQDKQYLEHILAEAQQFLAEKLLLQLHPNKVTIETLGSGVDFLGWVHFPKHKVLRTVTKKRMMRKLNDENRDSYAGMLSQGSGYKMQKHMNDICIPYSTTPKHISQKAHRKEASA